MRNDNDSIFKKLKKSSNQLIAGISKPLVGSSSKERQDHQINFELTIP